MAKIIAFSRPVAPACYSVDISQYADDFLFTVNGIKVNKDTLSKIADQLEKIAQIIRADVVTGVV